jgi:hypothetical protein
MAWARAATPGNTVNPMVVSGTQQARDRAVAKAAKVVRNHEGGTSTTPGEVGPKRRRLVGLAGGRAARWSDGGAVFDVTVKVVQASWGLTDREMRSRTRST